MNKIIVKKVSKNHLGVFATTDIKKGEIIETCPVIIVPFKDQKLIDKTHLYNYYFKWSNKNQPAIVLGWGSLYNHSYQPNARYDQKVKKRQMIFKAIKNIKKGQEIYTNYNGDPEDQSALWFKVKKQKIQN